MDGNTARKPASLHWRTEELKLSDDCHDRKHKVKLTLQWLDNKRWPTMTQSNIQSDPVLKPINKAVLSDRFVSCALNNVLAIWQKPNIKNKIKEETNKQT